VRLEGLGEESSNLIANRTRDLPAGSIVGMTCTYEKLSACESRVCTVNGLGEMLTHPRFTLLR
jgi:hypothetical protein